MTEQERQELYDSLQDQVKMDDAGHWVWQGKVFGLKNMPIVEKAGHNLLAARLMMSAILGRQLECEEFVERSCSNERCINPAHLHIFRHVEEDFIDDYEMIDLDYADSHYCSRCPK